MDHGGKNDPESRLALILLRSERGWDQATLARETRTARSQLSVYERGERAAPREVLEKAALATGFPVELLDALLWALRSFRAVSRGKSRADRVFAHGLAAELIALIRSALDVVLRPRAGGPLSGGIRTAAEERSAAAALWARLEPCTAAERRMLVEELDEYRTWGLCERVAAESIGRAANRPREALELAELALLIAGWIPADAAWRSRLQGYAWAHVSNARRACNDLPAAEEALARAWSLWEAGAAADPGLLNQAWLPGLDAALRRTQRRFPEALKRIDEALALDSGELRGQILLTRARIHEELGDPEASTAALAEAALLIDPDRQPRDAFGVRFNLVVDLCGRERFAEAEPRLGEVRSLAERLGGELDLARVSWLEGKVAAGLGRFEEARAALEQTASVFLRRELAYDYALVSLELAALLLDHGHAAEVSRLAGDMLWIFRAKGVDREALAALRLFCDAARRESLTVELARRAIGEIEKSRRLTPSRD